MLIAVIHKQKTKEAEMNLLTLPINFCGIPSNKGVEYAPEKILKELKKGILNEDGISPNFDIKEFKNTKSIDQELPDTVSKILKESGRLLTLGGDHMLTYFLVGGFASISNNPGIVIFDAHPDAREKYYSLPYDLLRVIISNNVIKKENIIIVGLREWSLDELQFMRTNRIRYFDMKGIAEYGLKDIFEAVMELANAFSDLYVSIDIDAVDPSSAPGTLYPVPGGLSSRELLFCLNRLKKMKNLKAVDIMEVNPDKDINGITVKLAAKLAAEMYFS